MAYTFPKFSDLPLSKEGPPLNAWGLYGKEDQLGFLNRLTNDVVVEAAKEIKSGVRISLNLPLDALGDKPLFGRQAFQRNIYQKAPRIVNDDVWTFNTQSSSQWDGFRHYGYQKQAKFYNGITIDDIHGPNKSNVNGIHAWAERGIVGRGILVDYCRWMEQQDAAFNPFERTPITLEHMQQVLAAQGTTARFGDILLVRTGYGKALAQTTAADRVDLPRGLPPGLVGVDQSDRAVLPWIWEHFAAVAGDQPAFECWPFEGEYSLHEILLAGWGCPIGELFDLEKLAQHCEKIKRWSFFVTSEVCNVPGGVASPPNILAIF